MTGRRPGMKTLGVCGGIASGKSQACKILREFPGVIAHIDADSLAHSVYAPGSSVIDEIADHFGREKVIDDQGCVDRKALGAIVFSSPEQMSALEQIVWPHVRSRLQDELDRTEQELDNNHIDSDTDTDTDRIAVVEAAVMLDAGWQDMFDGLWVVKTPRDVAISRMVEYRKMSANDAALRIDAQELRRGIGNLEDEVNAGVVSAVVENVGDIDDLSGALRKAWDDPSSWKYDKNATS
eukprot:CAMPEP_0196819264 /NCGR_PEP_ID=MMETSP1362-20130617/69784_1 /TAXON_ID=163516 /ORGANISM="Leptocylindrus danicus, Strain CCMP1856" /LENGTH=237 /DNA_ID=CAMNT_0042197681 /DNA_START=55 /DNA_END=768 /DNA_ORIENTATION=-